MRHRTRLLWMCILVSLLICLAANSVPAQTEPLPTLPSEDILSCSPAPCVLPPTQGSAGGYSVVDAAIASNPLNRNELLLGGDDSKLSAGGDERILSVN